ncbi:MAG: 2-oxoglutarate dehydrogenase complex dihydrolipoyllysine-residue succinyltransferase [Magnetococcales bacterium]|nr:2-oxoglutarate dehydrogenase complex dihydrolipoyllysine-residue succinyltransferase [Magnetococcales bacterium]MBF0149752.1 2-oxoglutarate dehydrogenase complex dihydrolipoyllysine-residue succinyltransferase [Magnetococcales bacterium]MBF0630687.1 2-oxoglutarate dehydrogenase complex dihydrolipoyllysine-residue succinyltransferase [Magnetococcales bacterium]
MAIDIIVPSLGESIMEATVVKWHKAEGDPVAAGEVLCELETDKVTLEVPAPAGGILRRIVSPVDTDVAVGALLGQLDAEGQGSSPMTRVAVEDLDGKDTSVPVAATPAKSPKLSPSVRKILEENDLNLSQIPATGAGNRLTKGDVRAFVAQGGDQAASSSPGTVRKPGVGQFPPAVVGPREHRVRMSRLRQRIAQRLKEAQNTAAMLTTFNEVDMTAVMALRQSYRDSFEKRHGVRLGFMSFFVKAAVAALQEFPAVNAEIQGDELVYRNYYDIGIAVGGSNGLVVPVLREADLLSLAGIEQQITEFGRRAEGGRLTLEELQGGTFTITNGGIFGSLLSTPILNTPQVGILGMHKIQQRPMVMPDGSIAARPMMYLALTYDHRVVDGREAVSFLVRIKECIEDPSRIMLGA